MEALLVLAKKNLEQWSGEVFPGQCWSHVAPVPAGNTMLCCPGEVAGMPLQGAGGIYLRVLSLPPGEGWPLPYPKGVLPLGATTSKIVPFCSLRAKDGPVEGSWVAAASPHSLLPAGAPGVVTSLSSHRAPYEPLGQPG